VASKIAATLYQKTTLDNGLRLITSEMSHTHSVSVVFFIGSGVCYENDSEAGISHFIEHLCFKGTKLKQSSKEISEAIEGVGGILNGGTDKELTVFWCKVASQHFRIALNVLVDLIRNSRFDLKDINKERQVIIEEINMSLDSPQQRVDMLIDELLWPGQPLGRDCAGSKEIINIITQQDILDFFMGHYLPNNTVLSIAGNIQADQVKEVVNNQLGDWKSSKLAPRLPSNIGKGEASVRVEKRNTEQVNLCLGIHGPSILHPDRFAVDLLSIILGEGMSSRLFIELRENKGLAYDISSGTAHFIDSGAFFVSAGVDLKRLDNALASIMEQLSKVREGVFEDELIRAKEMVKGQLLMALEDSRFVANRCGAQELLAGRILTIDETIPLIESVTIEDLRRVAKQIITGEGLTLALVGPVNIKKKFENMLKL
jgi:predicted Zn-dependent peptidase